MSYWFILICYLFCMYGASFIVTQAEGPFGVFRHIRDFTAGLSDNLGMLFRCMICFPTNLGVVFSIIDWFCINTTIAPFNLLLMSTGMWWLAAIMDGCLVGAFCHIMANFENYLDKNTPIYEDE